MVKKCGKRFNEYITVLARDNIKYGKLTAKPNQVQVAARKACMHSKISSTPYRYSTKVKTCHLTNTRMRKCGITFFIKLGERGVTMSGGERQRISIARVMLKNPKIILLDEATSALDKETETKIHKTLDEFCKDKTTVVVTHRLASVMDADQILVLSDECISERGT